uniref:Uncharacterized protein n=1 Tax=Heterorhabditis bacteriophora TaxID=37862 RepID=A0A1I7XM43_HETBA
MSSDVSRAGSSLSVSGCGVKRKSSCPFGEGYYSKLTRFLLSEEASAVEELKECVKMVPSRS